MPLPFLSVETFQAVKSFVLLDPPSWTRLEPQSSSGDPRPGIEARVHDPLWFLCRQWQLGEFQGEDAGTPLTVRVVTRTAAVDRWAAGDADEVRILDRAQQDLLEPLVEREPAGAGARGPGLRARAEAGAALLAALDDADLTAHRDAVIANCPLDLDPSHHPDGAHAALDANWLRLVRLLGGRGAADGELLCLAFEAAGGGLPAWLVPAGPAEGQALQDTLAGWAAWYRAEVSPEPSGGDAWVGARLEYRFRVAAGTEGDGQVVLDAPAHAGGEIDWHVFDALPDETLADPAGAQPPPEAGREIHSVLASPLRYAGMPADRFWEMEDAQVNVGVVEAEPWDLARLLVAEFALTYGNDWLVVPLDVPFGSLTTVESIVYTTTFGERFRVEPTATVSPDGDWRMFTLTTADGNGSSDGLIVPPSAVAVQDGPPIEEVLFLRDEMANMVWAVERSVQGPSGVARDRSRERDDSRPRGPGPVATAELDYLLQSGVPARWIPYLPRSRGYRAIELVQGAMPDLDGHAVLPLGVLLRDARVDVLKDAEIPREGVLVRRVSSMTRRPDGTYVHWTTRRVGIGRGEGASRLAFDAAIDRHGRQ